MVLLVAENLDQISFLETLLIYADIPYTTTLSDVPNGIGKPYLVVNGVILDLGRAIKWIEEQKNNE